MLAHQSSRYASEYRLNNDPAAPRPNAPDSSTDSGRGSIAPGALEKLAQALGPGGAASVQKVILLYLHDTPERFAQMRLAVERGDADALARAAHSMKSSSASVGAMQFASMCQALEAMGRGGVLDVAVTAINSAGVEFDRVHASLTRQITGD